MRIRARSARSLLASLRASSARAAAARTCSGSTNTKKRCTCRSTAPRRSTSTARLPALNALRGTSFDPSPTARDRSRRGPRVLLHPDHARDAGAAVAPQRPAVRARAARGRRHAPARRGARRSPGRRTSSSATATCSSTADGRRVRGGKDVGTVGWNGRRARRRSGCTCRARSSYHNTGRDNHAAATSWCGSSR